MIAVSVTTEKSNRAIEILVTSVNSNSLIGRKNPGRSSLRHSSAGCDFRGSIRQLRYFPGSLGKCTGFSVSCTAHVWVVYTVFGLLGYLLYAFLFGMLGALVSKTEDISKSSGMVTMLYVVSFLVAMMGMGNSDSILIRAASFIPFTSHQCNAVPGHHGKRGTLGNSYIRRDPCSDLPWSRYSVSEDLPSWYADVWKSSKIYHRFKTAAQ